MVFIGVVWFVGAHAPARPVVSVLGRNEVFISWEAPENPLGKINRYDLTINGKVVYSGTEMNFTAHRLSPDTEYSFTVSLSILNPHYGFLSSFLGHL